MFLLPAFAALGASFGWATGIVLAQMPAQRIGAFEFTRIQLLTGGATLALLCTIFGLWDSVDWGFSPAFAASSVIGILLGNLAMIECLRRGGPRRTELLLALKAPVVALMAYGWLGEALSMMDLLGGAVALAGIGLAIFFGGKSAAPSDAVKGSLGLVLLLGVVAAGFQGFGFLIVKPAMQAGAEPLAISAIRLLGAALVISLLALWPAALFRSETEVTPLLLGRTILPGLIGYGLSSSLLLYAFANFDAGVATVLGSLSPVLVLPILWIKDGVAPRPLAVAGAGLAVLGVSILLMG